MKTKTIVTICSVLFSINSLIAQLSTPYKLPQEVVSGRLDNGMHYFILHNQEPKDRVSFYFAQNVGAILEEDNEDGLAHFLEHMAFNGSTNFTGNSMDDFLEKNGLVFGRDLNAYTAHDETLYNIDNVPTANENIIDKCLLILHDWSGSLLLKEKDIDEERGVIAEEWRQRRTSNTRVMEKLQPILYEGSPYAKRDVIGQLDFIRTFPYKSLRDYYKKWYRPDLQAVIVVGDIDPKKMEEKVKKTFSDIKMPNGAMDRPYYQVPDQSTMSYIAIKDVGIPNMEVQWIFREDVRATKDEQFLANGFIKSIFNNVINERLTANSENPSSPILYAEMFEYPLALEKNGAGLYIEGKKNKLKNAFKEVYTELVRIQKFGITEAELKRAKDIFENLYKQGIARESSKKNSDWAQELAGYFLRAEPVLKASKYYDLVVRILGNIQLNDVQKYSQTLNVNNSVLSVLGPDDNNLTYPVKDSFMEIINEVNTSKVEQIVETANDGPMVEKILKAKPIKGTFKIEGIEKAQGYVLGNGLKVILYPSKEKEDEISMNAVSFGGTSQLHIDDLPSAGRVDDLIQLSGVGKFSASELNKRLAGKNAYVSPYLDQYTEGFSGSTTNEDFELLLQLTYMYFESPRFDRKLFENQLKSWKESIKNELKDEQTVFQNKMAKAVTNSHKRTLTTSVKNLDKVSFDRAVKVYKDRFANASDFTFIFTGNFNKEKVLLQLQKYLGNIKSTNTIEKWVDHKMLPKDGITEVNFKQSMPTPQSTIFYQLSGNRKYTPELTMKLQILTRALDISYNQTIREEEGGSYGVSVYAQHSTVPSPRFEINVFFNCNPDKREELLGIMRGKIQSLMKSGISLENMNKAKENLLKDRKEAETQDRFWMQQIIDRQIYGIPHLSLTAYSKILNEIDGESMDEFIKSILEKYDTVEVVMNPK